jgi:hypothetical protein
MIIKLYFEKCVRFFASDAILSSMNIYFPANHIQFSDKTRTKMFRKDYIITLYSLDSLIISVRGQYVTDMNHDVTQQIAGVT